MKGIYLTTEAKQELEAKIVELEAKAEYYEAINSRHRRGGALAQIFILQEILEYNVKAATKVYSEDDLREAIAEAWNSCEDNEDNETFTQVFNRIIQSIKQPKTIETKDYTLAVSNEALKENDYALDLTEDMGLKYDVFIVDKATLKFANQECKKIIAYQPKGNAPTLDLQLLPEIVAEDDVEKLALKVHPILMEDDWDKNKQYRDEWIAGHKAATKTYSEEDLRKAIELSRINYKEKTFGTVLPKYKPGEIVNLVKQAKPKLFVTETEYQRNMKGIYLTEEGKQEIKEELLRIENESINYAEDELNDITAIKTRYNILKEILECATILPIE